jgi:hypothetical protein
MGHHAVLGMITRRRLGAETVVTPIERLLTRQIKVVRLCRHVNETAGVGPFGAPQWLL